MENTDGKLFLVETLQIVRRYYAFKAATVEAAKAEAALQNDSNYSPHFHKEELPENVGQAYEITEADLFKMMPDRQNGTKTV